VHCTKISPSSNFVVKGQCRQGQKKRKSAAFGQERFSRSPVVSSASSTPVGKSAHAV